MITELIKLLPDYYDENETMQELQRIISIYVKDFEREMDVFVLNARPDKTVDIERWEKIYGIAPDATMGLPYRREKLAAKMSASGTSTVEAIKRYASKFTNGEVDVTENYQNYGIVITFTGTIGVPPYLESFKTSLLEIIPAHLTVTFVIIYNEHKHYENVTHGFMSAYTHEQLRSSEIETA